MKYEWLLAQWLLISKAKCFYLLITFMGCPGQNHEAALVPEFGAWDVTDPKSGEGYTAIFSEVRKEKQIASGHMPSKTPSPNNRSDIRNQCGRPSSFLPKVMLLHHIQKSLVQNIVILKLNMLWPCFAKVPVSGFNFNYSNYFTFHIIVCQRLNKFIILYLSWFLCSAAVVCFRVKANELGLSFALTHGSSQPLNRTISFFFLHQTL